MIVIAGDSWGRGCWNDQLSDIYHRGLEQYLHDDGHIVVNLSRGGLSLELTAQRIKDFLSINTPLFVEDPVRIFVFQTEWHRGKDSLTDSIIPMLRLDQDVEYWNQYNSEGDDQKIISSFYGVLSHLATKHAVPIYLIGGCSDTFWLDNFEKHYPGVKVVCQSLTNLLINDNHRIDTPVHTIAPPKWLFDKEHAIQTAILGNERANLWEENPQWFYPDGTHANHHGHKKLYEHLQTEGVI